MSDPALGLTMLCLIVITIMMGFPTAFTLTASRPSSTAAPSANRP